MKITIYTTTNCQFSKQEKEYLTSHSFAFEEKNLDSNKAFLTEMMTIGNNFAGTPVTKIEKDDGTIAVLKGFTVEEFNTALGIAEAPKTEEVKPVEAMPAAVAPTIPTSTPPPAAPAAPEPPINDVLSKLETNINDSKPVPVTPAVPAIPTVESPSPVSTTPPMTPPVPGSDTPAIPDFPADAATQPSK